METKTGGAHRLEALTGLRFFLAAAVVAYHLQGYGLPTAHWGSGVLHMGVSLFFVLSGFVLTHVYSGLNSGVQVKNFLVARVARIWPGHLAALVLLYVVLEGDPSFHGTGQDSLILGLTNIFLIHSWIPLTDYFFGYNSVSWSLSVELFFYLAFPILVWRLDDTKGLKLAFSFVLSIACLEFALLSNLPALPVPGATLSAAGVMCFNPVARLFEFVTGMIAARLWRQHGGSLPRGRVSASIMEVAIIATVVFVAHHLGLVATQTQPSVNASLSVWISKGGLLAPATALLIAVFASGHGCFSRLLASAPMRVLGEISFMIYLVHQIVLRAYVLRKDWFADWSGAQSLSLYICVVLVISALMWRFVETPLRRWIIATFSATERRTMSERSDSSGRQRLERFG
ncbi:MAG: acyltransferase [Rhodospirillaceae bacterium]|nr:acyltransferase [Rhodospirillaceae bacterium]